MGSVLEVEDDSLFFSLRLFGDQDQTRMIFSQTHEFCLQPCQLDLHFFFLITIMSGLRHLVVVQWYWYTDPKHSQSFLVGACLDRWIHHSQNFVASHYSKY